MAAVNAGYSNLSVLSKLGGTKDLCETICRLPDSDGFSWDLHSCFYTMPCAHAQGIVIRQVSPWQLMRYNRGHG